MLKHNILSSLILKIIKVKYEIEEDKSKDIGNPKRVLVVRQHKQFGDLLANVSLFRALKEKFPNVVLNVIVSKQNYYGITSNEFVDEYFVFDQKVLWSSDYRNKLKGFLRNQYDLAIVPSTVAISFTSNFLARISDAKIRIGPSELNGEVNKASFLFDRRVILDWRKYPDSHVSDFGLDIIRSFGIYTRNFSSSISYSEEDRVNALKFINEYKKENSLVVGLHVGAGKPRNRWSLEHFIELIDGLDKEFDITFYFTGTKSDSNEIDYIKSRIKVSAGFFMDKSIPELAALIAQSNLFITNDTGVMHVAGTTRTPQISIFGPTNPFNWAPVGASKYFVRKSELIDDVTVQDVYNLSYSVLSKKLKTKHE